MQDGFARDICKINVIEGDLSFEPSVGGWRAVGVRMFPCPLASSLSAFDWIAVLVFFGVHKLNVSVISLRWSINDFKDTSCAR